MIISTCGFGNTGASAVLDFLQGYSDLQRISDFEFQLFHMPDGINDLKYHLVFSRERIAGNAAIKRYERAAINGYVGREMRKKFGYKYVELTQSYLHRLIQVSWYGYSRFDPIDVSNRADSGLKKFAQDSINKVIRRVNNQYTFPRNQERYLAVLSESEFNSITREYFNSCLKLAGFDPDEDILIDMLFSAMNPEQGAEIVEKCKTIVVFRDPRDLFIRASEHKATNGHTPCENVDDFIVHYRTLMEKRIQSDKVLEVQYEDLIYKYYETTNRIIDYFGFSQRPENEFQFFNPDISVKYTQAWKTYPGHEKEIEYIKKELSEYLYSYGEYVPVAEQARI